MEGLAVNITVVAVLELSTERALLRIGFAAYATEYAVMGLAVETTGCDALKLHHKLLHERCLLLS